MPRYACGIGGGVIGGAVVHSRERQTTASVKFYMLCFIAQVVILIGNILLQWSLGDSFKQATHHSLNYFIGIFMVITVVIGVVAFRRANGGRRGRAQG
ncbi:MULTISPECIES: hypothetical protein [Winkia]|uniref:hypothetical protein n=1 Tax=Winkia TaxID=2692118 RepID=UPI00058BB9A2|nr:MULTISPECIES: hypothetical protein [Winkia]MDK6241069.1 hypothetical protein [Winkia sp. UMB10116]MDK8341808.1 hypothetical protein [Winkia sp. UMB3164B]PLB80302.1 hypothetical protein CYJ21_06440 [Actinomyces sp. UMB0138]PMC94313.1 hypothetical protein CJ188_03580 [Actinomyces sp. UMB0918]MBS5947465.1 hypothetical protein [Winkia neuii]